MFFAIIYMLFLPSAISIWHPFATLPTSLRYLDRHRQAARAFSESYGNKKRFGAWFYLVLETRTHIARKYTWRNSSHSFSCNELKTLTKDRISYKRQEVRCAMTEIICKAWQAIDYTKNRAVRGLQRYSCKGSGCNFTAPPTRQVAYGKGFGKLALCDRQHKFLRHWPPFMG
jgi:hypothetical protein